MTPRVGQAVLALSGAGFPLTQAIIRRGGRRGALASAGICAGLLVRDAALVASGTPARLRPGPARLLWLELAVAGVAVAAGLPAAFDDEAARRAAAPRPDGPELVRRAAVALLFGLHTLRFRIYLQPDRARKPATG